MSKPPAPSRLVSATLSARLTRSLLLFSLTLYLGGLWAYRHVPPFGTDSLIYHLTIPVRWLKQGFFTQTDLPFHDGMAQHGGLLGEVCAWGMMSLTGDDGLTWLIQPGFFLLLLWFYWHSLRLLGVRREGAAILTALLAACPSFAKNTLIFNADITLTCGVAIFLYGLLRIRIHPARGILWTCAGLAITLGAKMSGLIYFAAGLGVAMGIGWLYRDRLRQVGLRASVKVGVFGILLLLGGAVFLLRNWFTYGNPLYPATFRLGGVTIFSGLTDLSLLNQGLWSWNSARQLLFNTNGAYALPKTYSVPLLLALPLAAVFMWLTSRRQPQRWDGAICGTLFPILAFALYLNLMGAWPFWHEQRFIFPVYYGFWLNAGFLYYHLQTHLSRRGVKILLGILAAALLASLLPTLRMLDSLSVLAALLVAVAGYATRNLPAAIWNKKAVILVAAMLVGVGIASPGWYAGYRKNRHAVRQVEWQAIYPDRAAVWAKLENLKQKNGALTIAYAGTSLIYPLFGFDFANTVRYIPLSADDHPQPVRLRPGSPIFRQVSLARRQRVDPTFWLRGLQKARVQYLYLGNDESKGGNDFENRIIAANPNLFRLIMKRGKVELYLRRD